MRTIVKIEDVGCVLVAASELAPSPGDDDPDACLGRRLENEICHPLRIVYDNASETNV